jgi:diguanylate cyclase (GGDEF)-like protein
MNHELISKESALLLVVEDDAPMRLMIRRVLERDGYEIREAVDGASALVAYEQYKPDLVLMDAILPGIDGFSAMQQITTRPEDERCPCLMLTGLNDDRSVEQAFACGATDYITKPLHWAVLRQRVRRILGTARAEQNVRYLAYHDMLTGLPNRLLLCDRFGQVLAQAHRQCYKLGVLFIDLDRFKMINDNFGHELGDQLLRNLSTRISASIRDTDTLARLGGDEFIVLLDNIAGPHEIEIVTHRILASIKQFNVIDGNDLRITGSLGVAVYPEDGQGIGDLIKHADTAMYRAKALGGDCFQYYQTEMTVQISRRWTLEKNLRRAVQQHEFVVHFQPIVGMDASSSLGVEALVRWQDPEVGLVSPMEFIPLAEETRLIVELGAQVLDQSCAALRQWHMSGLRHLYVTVNVSVVQLQDANFVKMVSDTLARYGLRGHDLCCEITESALMDKVGALGPLRELKELGMRIAIDDFGTGYSSLSYLKVFPVDIIKVDRAFVNDMLGDSGSHAIAAAVITLAHGLHCAVIAEGVETMEQFQALQDLRCDAVQGYLFSRPLPFEQVLPRLTSLGTNRQALSLSA